MINPAKSFEDVYNTHVLALEQRDQLIEQLRAEVAQLEAEATLRPLDIWRDRFAFVVERDCQDWMKSSGPIVMESLASASAFQILERAERMGSAYGQVMICRLQPIGDPATFAERLRLTGRAAA